MNKAPVNIVYSLDSLNQITWQVGFVNPETPLIIGIIHFYNYLIFSLIGLAVLYLWFILRGLILLILKENKPFFSFNIFDFLKKMKGLFLGFLLLPFVFFLLPFLFLGIQDLIYDIFYDIFGFNNLNTSSSFNKNNSIDNCHFRNLGDNDLGDNGFGDNDFGKNDLGDNDSGDDDNSGKHPFSRKIIKSLVEATQKRNNNLLAINEKILQVQKAFLSDLKNICPTTAGFDKRMLTEIEKLGLLDIRCSKARAYIELIKNPDQQPVTQKIICKEVSRKYINTVSVSSSIRNLSCADILSFFNYDPAILKILELDEQAYAEVRKIVKGFISDLVENEKTFLRSRKKLLGADYNFDGYYNNNIDFVRKNSFPRNLFNKS